MDNRKSNKAIDILMQEYSLHKSEIFLLITNYKFHVRYFQIIATGLIAIFGLILPNSNYAGLMDSRLFWILLMYLIPTAVSYTIFTVLETQYSIQILGARLSVVEDTINNLAGEKLLAWEIELSPKLYSIPRTKFLVYPGIYLFFYTTMLICAAFYAVPIYAGWRFLNAPLDQIWLFRSLVSLNFVYSSVSLFFIVRVANDILSKDKLWRRTRKLAQRINAKHLPSL